MRGILSAVAVALLATGCASSTTTGPTSPTASPVTTSTTSPVTTPATTPVTQPATAPATTLPSAATLEEVAEYLAGQGVPCERLDIENRGATESPSGAYNRAMCYRAGAETLEVLLYRSAADLAAHRLDSTSHVPCTLSTDLAALAGSTMSLASGANFEVRATSSFTPTVAELAQLNTVTEQLAAQVHLSVVHATFICAP